MAISTYMTFLMHEKQKPTFEKLVDITEFPDLGADRDLLETTTTSHRAKTYILGIIATEGLKFSANYDPTEYKALKALEGKDEGYAVWIGGTENEDGTVTPTGSNGKFSFKGQLSVHVTGGKVNEVLGMAITIAPSTAISEE
nr:MAG TPA: Major tail protein [Caudoviricetes sp.]